MTPDKTPSTMETMQVAGAFTALRAAFDADPTSVWAWQCALAASQQVAGVDPKPAHQGAAHVLLTHLGVNVITMQAYTDLMHPWR